MYQRRSIRRTDWGWKWPHFERGSPSQLWIPREASQELQRWTIFLIIYILRISPHKSYLTDSPYRPNLLLSNSWAWSWSFSKELSVWRWLQFQIWSSVFDTWTSMILRQLKKVRDYFLKFVFQLWDSVGPTLLVTISAPEMMNIRCQVLRAPFSVTGFSRNKSVLVNILSFTYSQSKSESGISTIGFFFCSNKSKEIWFNRSRYMVSFQWEQKIVTYLNVTTVTSDHF